VRLLLISGAAGIVAAVYGILSMLASTFLCGPGCGSDRAFNPWAADGSFSSYSNSLSSLGVSKIAGFFNASIILFGVLLAIFSAGFVKAHVRRGTSNALGVMLILCSGMFSLVGILTENFGSLHQWVGFLSFGLYPVAILLLGLSMSGVGVGRGAVAAGGLATLVAIVGEVLVYQFPGVQIGFAVSEILELVIIAAWVFLMGIDLTLHH
jgi:hypothetical membrane protein